MKAYADCRSGCYNKYFSPFIDTYRPPRMNKRLSTPEVVSSEHQEARTTDEMCTVSFPDLIFLVDSLTCPTSLIV